MSTTIAAAAQQVRELGGQADDAGPAEEGFGRFVTVDPDGGEATEVLVEGAGNDPAVGLVGVEGARVTASQLQGCVRFPFMAESV